MEIVKNVLQGGIKTVGISSYVIHNLPTNKKYKSPFWRAFRREFHYDFII